MPFVAGAMSCRCFRVSGNPPADFRKTYATQIQRYAFIPPKVESGERRAFGWTHPERILESKVDLDDVLIGQRLILGFRIDSVALNNRIYKARLREEFAAVRKEKGRERLSRDEKRAIEEQLQLKMLKTQSPSTAIHEMAWNLKRKEAFFSSTGEKVVLEFMELFGDTFDLALEPALPYVRARAIAERQGLDAALEAAAPAVFSTLGAGVARAARPEIIDMESEPTHGTAGTN